MASSKRLPRYGPYHRVQGQRENDLMQRTGMVGGRAPRNIFAGAIPKVKAFAGELPPGRTGVEFWTDVRPDEGRPPSQPSWSKGQPGVQELENDLVAIAVIITKRVD